MSGLWFEQFEVGQIFSHDIRKTVTESDNALFCAMTYNPAAIHVDHHYCASTEFGAPLVNSVFTLGLVVGLSVQDTTMGTTVANLGFSDIEFPAPVLVGDTIRAETEVIELRASKSRPHQGIVKFEHRGLNHKGEVVCRARRSALMLREHS
ncbi:MAG: MaoC family dehydratase [Parvibaculaceae bacterium]